MTAPKHRVWAEIHLDRLEHNLHRIRDRAGADKALLPVIKADSYGHGAVQVARVCRKVDATMLGLASTQEAEQLREAGIERPLLILGEILPSEIPRLVQNFVRPTVQSKSMVRRIGKAASDRDITLPVHVSVDTGMSRLGAPVEKAVKLACFIRDHSSLSIEGASTHLSHAYEEEGKSFTERQLNRFQRFLSLCDDEDLEFRYVHAANSGGVFAHPRSRFNMVRPGIAIFGVFPGELAGGNPKLEPVMSFRTKLVHVKQVEADRPIGYGRSYRVPEQTRVGVLSAGYHDGYPFKLSNSADVLIQGTRCPVIGRVTMDYVMVDLGPVQDPRPGEVATLMGRDGSECITASELAERAGTIPYEILCSIGERVHRIYRTSIDSSRENNSVSQ